MKTILVPIDFSPVSRAVLLEARKLARLIRGRIVLVHVVKQPIVIADYLGTVVDESAIVTSAERAGRAHLTRLHHELSAAGISSDQRVFIGIPAFDILREAKKLRPEYIVIGSHGHNAFYNFVVGSTTAAILKEASCPVVVVASPSQPERKARRAKRK